MFVEMISEIYIEFTWISFWFFFFNDVAKNFLPKKGFFFSMIYACKNSFDIVEDEWNYLVRVFT